MCSLPRPLALETTHTRAPLQLRGRTVKTRSKFTLGEIHAPPVTKLNWTGLDLSGGWVRLTPGTLRSGQNLGADELLECLGQNLSHLTQTRAALLEAAPRRSSLTRRLE